METMVLNNLPVDIKDIKSNQLYLDCERAAYFYKNKFGIHWLTVAEADERFGEDTPANAIFTLKGED